jgi:uncharacterized protein (UPF0218 family)
MTTSPEPALAAVPAERRRTVLKPGPARQKLAEELAALYKKGASIRVLAAQQQKSYGFIHQILTVDARLELRPRNSIVDRRTRKQD